MDAAAQYRHLLQLGREEFLAAAAPAAFVRYRGDSEGLAEHATTLTMDQNSETVEETLPHHKDYGPSLGSADLEVYPLTKKAGASFPDRITIGRITNNDIVINEHSISRLHAYVRLVGKSWVVADAGSKNGSWLGTSPLEARKECKLPSRAVLRLGDIDLTFFLAADLFAALGGS